MSRRQQRRLRDRVRRSLQQEYRSSRHERHDRASEDLVAAVRIDVSTRGGQTDKLGARDVAGVRSVLFLIFSIIFNQSVKSSLAICISSLLKIAI